MPQIKKEGGQVRKAHELRIRNEELGMKRQGESGENNHGLDG